MTRPRLQGPPAIRARRTPPRVLVLGGGLAGIINALLLARCGANVTVIERGAELAAGWRGVSACADLDAGLRIPARSGIEWADRIIFDDTAALSGEALRWNVLPRPAFEGHVAAGTLCDRTPILDCRCLLSRDQLIRARAELLDRAEKPDPGPAAPDLATRLSAIFGPTVSSEVLAPAVRAMIGLDPEDLSWRAADNRLPLRIVVAGAGETDRLMRFGQLRSRLGHPDIRKATGHVGPAYVYPRDGGIARWTNALIAHLRLMDVSIVTGVKVVRLNLRSNSVTSLQLSTGLELAGDAIVLAAPPSVLGPEFDGANDLCPSRAIAVAHLVLAGPEPPHDLYWFASYDPSTLVHRAAFLNRMRGDGRPGSTTSILLEYRRADVKVTVLVNELRELRAVHSAQRLMEATLLPSVGFPLETRHVFEVRQNALNSVRRLQNVFPTMAATGGFALLHQLIRDGVENVTQLDLTRQAQHAV